MDRRRAFVTGGVTAAIVVSAAAAVAANTGLVSGADEVAGTLDPATVLSVQPGPDPDIETIVVDVYDQPAQGPGTIVVEVPDPNASVIAPASTGDIADDDGAYYDEDDSYEDDDGSYEDEDGSEDHEYEGWDEDD